MRYAPLPRHNDTQQDELIVGQHVIITIQYMNVMQWQTFENFMQREVYTNWFHIGIAVAVIIL
jgi:hypothetical protein